ncbi:MAG: UDP-3-O-(3-hydroxymyristoyl)glucosamine N-acyltransferase [Pirellulaceae bacterium]|nr:UDP-3-O-(3-hydroxymyristoyl)glucosamine N-acyltransferase [Pirellulaceae bacterium]
MSTTLGSLAGLVCGDLHGDPETVITGAAIIRDATSGEITLADDAKLAADLAACAASAVIVKSGFQPDHLPFISVNNVHVAFARIVEHFQPPREHARIGVRRGACVSPSAKIGENVEIYPGAIISDEVEIEAGCTIHAGVRVMSGCHIGKDVTVFPNVVLYENTIVGNRVILHAGCVLGAHGFGYATVDGCHQLSAQLGNVVVEDDVEIGACTTIDRGTYGSTVIGEGTKIDNQVMIAHNCRIGRHNLICSQVGIAGSSTSGDYVVMAGQVGVGDHINIGHQVTLGAKAGVMSDITDGQAVVGIPATPIREQMIKQAALAKLPEMRKQFKTLQAAIDELLELARDDSSHPEAA